MYFFDIDDYCGYSGYIPAVIGPNAQNYFLNGVGDMEDLATTYRASKDALYNSVNQWYNVSNPPTITYEFIQNQTLTWPSSTATYTLYNGGFNSFDDGWSNNPISLPIPFSINGVSSSNLFVGTNGYFTLGSGSNVRPTTPVEGPPATICGNPGDNWLEPGLQNDDLDIQNVYYKTGYEGQGRHFVKLLVYGGTYSGVPIQRKVPTSWVANFYRDTKYQWLEVMIKSTSTVRGSAGPYNVSSVAQTPTTTTKVWRSDLNGQNWEYLGLGTVSTPEIPSRTCPECDDYFDIFMATQTNLDFFWDDAENRFVNISPQQYQQFVYSVYNNVKLLKLLIACVDGDTFEDFTI